MKAESADYLAKAHGKLDTAARLMDADLPDLAAREAYLAALSAARALIFERRAIAPKSHTGTISLFAEIAVKTGAVSIDTARILARGFELKQMVDYELADHVTLAEAIDTLARARSFVAAVESLLAP
jgi:uncharacterized protein (UPF0332 family)